MTEKFLAKVRRSGGSKVITIPYLEAQKYEIDETVEVTLSELKK